jgi:hypothetical protein
MATFVSAAFTAGPNNMTPTADKSAARAAADHIPLRIQLLP